MLFFPTVASGRPDKTDLKLLIDFTKHCLAKLTTPITKDLELTAKSNVSSKIPSFLSLVPTVNQQRCSLCGLCANYCPTKAISHNNPWKKMDIYVSPALRASKYAPGEPKHFVEFYTN